MEDTGVADVIGNGLMQMKGRTLTDVEISDGGITLNFDGICMRLDFDGGKALNILNKGQEMGTT